ncbi:MAG TPA: hypothetical protein VFL85_01460 [Candidatus Saccharimonadales bacterium]|nr:hypothetical protein [Candidatus Saccharimonadales bacterium]
MLSLNDALHAAGTAYDYLTPGKGSSRVTDIGHPDPAPVKRDTINPYAVSWTAPDGTQYNAGGDPIGKATKDSTPDWLKKAQAENDRLGLENQRLLAQLAAQPKLPYYNTTAALTSAQKKATSLVNPVYVDNLNRYLAKQQAGIGQQTELTGLNKKSLQTALEQTLQDTELNKQRTQEDLTTKLGDINQTETNYQTDEGAAFDKARTALLGNIANSGLTTSGIGQQQEAQAITDRNQASKEQTQQFSNQRRDVNTLATRTFADLETGATRAKSDTTAKQHVEDVNLKDYIQNAKLDEKDFRASNEQARLDAVAKATGQQYQAGLAKFIAGLIGSGARAQDIALAKSVYGGYA